MQSGVLSSEIKGSDIGSDGDSTIDEDFGWLRSRCSENSLENARALAPSSYIETVPCQTTVETG